MRGLVSIGLLCNNPDNGNFTGRVEALDIGDGILKLDNKYWPPRGPALRYDFKACGECRGWGAGQVEGRVKVSRRFFPVVGYKYGWGNWCWDLIVMTPETAVPFLNYLKSLDCFQPEGGFEEFYDAFTEPDTEFTDDMIPDLRSYGYQAP